MSFRQTEDCLKRNLSPGAARGIIVEKNEKLDKAADCLKVLKERNAITEEQVSILFLLMQNEFFDSTIGRTRKQLVKYTKKTDYLINKTCNDLETSGYIIVIKKRPKTLSIEP